MAWHEAWTVADRERRTQREAQAAADLARYHEIGMRVRWCVENTGRSVAECIAEARQPLELDPDVLALLDRAEAYLQESLDVRVCSPSPDQSDGGTPLSSPLRVPSRPVLVECFLSSYADMPTRSSAACSRRCIS